MGKQKIFLVLFSVLISICSCSNDDRSNMESTVSDIDGNIYKTIKIGNQTWMAENLKTTSYNDGTSITQYTFQTNGTSWTNFSDPVALYQWADTSDLNDVYDDELAFDYHGALYNHFAIESGKLAPAGWRIPSVEDFRELERYLKENGNEGEEAKTLKSTFGWVGTDANGTDALGFNALPTGYISGVGTPTGASITTLLATTNLGTEFPGTSSQKRISVGIQATESELSFAESSVIIGLGIRCIKE